MSWAETFLAAKLQKLSPENWDALIRSLEARFGPLEEQLNVERRVADDILKRGIQVISDEIQPSVDRAQAAADDAEAAATSIAADLQAAGEALIASEIQPASDAAQASAAQAAADAAAIAAQRADLAAGGLSADDVSETASRRWLTDGRELAIQTAAVEAVRDGVDAARDTLAEVASALDLKADASAVYTQAQVDAAIQTAIDGMIDGAPAALDTLNELAAALADDADYAASITTALASKLDLAGGVMSGDLTTTGVILEQTGQLGWRFDANTFLERIDDGDVRYVCNNAERWRANANGIRFGGGGEYISLVEHGLTDTRVRVPTSGAVLAALEGQKPLASGSFGGSAYFIQGIEATGFGYLWVFENVRCNSAGATLGFRVRRTGDAGANSGSSDYSYARRFHSNTSSTHDGANSSDHIPIHSNLWTGSTGFSGMIKLINPAASDWASVLFEAVGFNSNGNIIYSNGGGFRRSVIPVDALQLFLDAGSFIEGSWRLYRLDA